MGVDFPSGKYDLLAAAGYGSVRVYASSDAFSGGASNYKLYGLMCESLPQYTDSVGLYYASAKNILLDDGMIIDYDEDLTVTFSPISTSTLAPDASKYLISQGIFIVGEDIPAGTCSIEATEGYGYIDIYSDYHEYAIDGSPSQSYSLMPSDFPTFDDFSYLFSPNVRGVQLRDGMCVVDDGVIATMVFR